MNDLYELLKSGRTPEDIAAEFTKNLNDAETRLREEEEARALEAAKQASRREDLVALMLDAEAYCRSYFPSLLDTEEKMTYEGWCAIADLVLSLLDLEVAKGTKSQVKVRVNSAPKMAHLNVDPVFADFFKQMGL